MTQERIDLTQFKEMDVTSMPIWYSKIPDLVAELKRCYDTMDTAVANLKELFEVTESSEVQSIANYLEGTNASE